MQCAQLRLGFGVCRAPGHLDGCIHEGGALAEKRGNFVVVDPKAAKQDFVLVFGVGTLEGFVCLAFGLSSLEHQRPKDGIVQVVDVRWVREGHVLSA